MTKRCIGLGVGLALAGLVPAAGQPRTNPAADVANAELSVLPVQGPPLSRGLPTDEYFTPTKDFYFNGEPVIVIHAANAHTASSGGI